MKNILDGIEDVLLMGPGPSCVPPSVYEALSRKTLGHMDTYFIQIMDEIKIQLLHIMKTENYLTLPISGTGSAGMEASFVNLIEKDDSVLILINGVFGERMRDVASRLGAKVDSVEFEWGTPVDPEKVREKVSKGAYKMVAMIHAETSTGVRNPAEEVADILRNGESIYLLDAVTSLGGIEVATDAWGVDVLYSGTQKCLSCPPGLAPASFSKKALAVILNRKTKVPNWYLDMSLLSKYWEGRSRVYHHTAPINMNYALYQALYLIMEEGLENVFRRHLENHNKLVEGLEGLGLKMLVKPGHRLPMLNSVLVPEGVREDEVRAKLRTRYKIEIGGGLGPLAGKIWRIGLMGHTARAENVQRVLTALRETLRK